MEQHFFAKHRKLISDGMKMTARMGILGETSTETTALYDSPT